MYLWEKMNLKNDNRLTRGLMTALQSLNFLNLAKIFLNIGFQKKTLTNNFQEEQEKYF